MFSGLKNLYLSFQKAFQQRPLFIIVLLAFIVRLLAVFFAKGYMMHDDHFLTIEPAASWADGKNFNQWLPGIGNDNEHPEPISFFYPGILFLIFSVMQFFGIDNPETQMYLMRLIHAAYSLLVVIYGYRITSLISNRKNAIRVGLLLAFIAIMPNFSVRNLVEMVSIPPLLIGFYLLLKHIPFKEFKLGGLQIPAPVNDASHQFIKPFTFLILAAVIMGLAVGIRYQTGLIVALVGLVLLLQHSFRYAFVFGVVSFSVFFLTQIDDILLWGGKPFQHLQGYFKYNKEHAGGYPQSPLTYLAFIALFILPPVSLMMVWGFLRSYKKYLILFLPVAGFLLFHILYPNRQERFILPALPFVVMLGVIGWSDLLAKSTFWLRNARLNSILWNIFWTINIAGMFVGCFIYSKKARVEAMIYIYNQHDCKNFALEFSHSDKGAMVPQFYSDQWTTYYYWSKNSNKPEDYILNMPHDEETTRNDIQPRTTPNYFLFYDDDNLEQRVADIREYFPSLTYQVTINYGWFDELLNWLNPKNSLEKIHIYKAPNGQEKFQAG